MNSTNLIDNLDNYIENDKGVYVEKPPHLITDYTIESLSFTKLVNTEYFSEAAKQFKENEKRGKRLYTLAPRGSKEYEDFWEQEKDRCLNGYQVGDLWICGRYYHYLNYFPMLRVPKGTDKSKSVVVKEIDFPSFWLIQYLWKHFQLVAHHGGTFAGIKSSGGLDVVCLKTRGAGFSYMDAHDAVYNYTFYRDSKSFIAAFTDKYLTGDDGAMLKVQAGVDHMNTCTGGFDRSGREFKSRWGHIRYDKGEEPMSFKSGTKSNSGEIVGFNSLISGVICDKDYKIRGKRAMKITLEEAGSFPTLEALIGSSTALVKDGAYKIGQRSVFGTGGEEGVGIAMLEELFYYPEAHDFMGFPDIFGGSNEKVGFFCPAYLANSRFINDDGTTDVQGAIKSEEEIRAKKKQASSRALDKHIAEYPFNPKEALKRLSNNFFAVELINARITKLQTDRSLTDNLLHCDIEAIKDKNGKVIKCNIVPNKHEPITKFPHENDDDLTGCCTILQQPFTVLSPFADTDENGVPNDMYLSVIDNFGVDESLSKTSLFACYIYKNYNNYDNEYAGVPVAWYVGRTANQSDSFQIAFNLSRMFNAKISGEYNAQGQLMIDNAKFTKNSDLLCETPVVIGKEITKRGFWEVVTTSSKLANIQSLANYLIEPRGYEIYDTDDDDFSIVGNLMIKNKDEGIKLNLDFYFDIPFLVECTKFKTKGGNFDRVSANSLAPRRIKKKEYSMKEQSQQNTELVLDKFIQEKIVVEDGFFVLSSNDYEDESETIKTYI